MKRRSFLSKSVKTGLAASVISQFPLFNVISRPLKSEKGLGIALVGLGNYSTNQLAPALQETKNCYLAGIVTGKYDKADSWIEKYSIPDKNVFDYTNFDDISENQDIDAVYIVLPNGLHAEYTIRGAEAGKHVICEKPMANNAADCKKMIDACKKAKKKLGIGYRLHYDPYNLEMMRLGQKEVYGKVTEIDAGFGFVLRNQDAWRMDKQLAGGGPLMDVGIYVLQGCIYTLGMLPESLVARDVTKEPDFYDDIEGTLEWELKFKSDVKVSCRTTYEDNYNYLKAQAEKGAFDIGPAYSYNGLKGNTPEGAMDFGNINQQAAQMDAYALHVLEGKELLVPGEMGWRDMFLIDRIYESAKTGKEVSLKGIPKILHKV